MTQHEIEIERNLLLYRESLGTSTCTLGCSQGMRQHHIALFSTITYQFINPETKGIIFLGIALRPTDYPCLEGRHTFGISLEKSRHDELCHISSPRKRVV